MSLGFEQAGFDVRVAVEIDPVHCAVHAFNFPNTAIICKSVSEVSGADIRKAGNIGDAEIAVVFGGAPCQGFSMMGKRVLDDPRNSLVLDFIRIIAELRPKHFVFENVKGITIAPHSAILEEMVDAFLEHGYKILQPWRVLNAVDYGVPQKRERLFLIGTRTGNRSPRYPRPSLERVTCGDALGDIPNAEHFPELVHTDSVKTHLGNPSRYAMKMRGLLNDDTDFSHPRVWDKGVLTGSLRASHTDLSRSRFLATTPGDTEPVSRFFKLAPDGFCNTLRAGTNTDRGAFSAPRPIHYAFPRCITVREAQRLHGYPDWFRMHVTKWHGFRQVGNSVPPPLAHAVASSVMAAMDGKPTRPTKAIKLGPVSLLQMDLTQASEHFNVQGRAIAPRTRNRDLFTATEEVDA
ncbi:DNA cytosine methyltransferase [Roseococcus sp. SDR]|nr:DNA cytosine methyltransferase [Roseococcus sp. SDR]MBV1847782.1 DNA cytosine methyltransferase [Roseococcus sp. SDR]